MTNTLFILFRTVFYVTGFIFFFGWLAYSLRMYDTRFGWLLADWVIIPGIMLMIFGGLLVLSCVLTFVFHGKGTPAIFDPPRQFVPTGPYRYVRNPMYIGGLILLLGFGLYYQSISILLFFIFLLILIHCFVIFIEEPGLRKRFGQSYIDYCHRITRWIPKKSRFGSK